MKEPIELDVIFPLSDAHSHGGCMVHTVTGGSLQRNRLVF